MIKLKNLGTDLRALVMGQMIGDVWFVDGDAGDDGAVGEGFDTSLKTLASAVTKPVTGHHDYILCFGAETATISVSISQADVHIIGIGNGGMDNVFHRGFQYSRVATADGFIPATTADGLEIAGIRFTEPATDAILIDDAGATGCFFHHNTVIGYTGSASIAIRLDIEGTDWTISDNLFLDCQFPIDVANARPCIERNIIHCNIASGIGIKMSHTNAHNYLIRDNIVNVMQGTTDTGVETATGADYGWIVGNMFNSACNDDIDSDGTGSLIVNNMDNSIAGTTAASIQRAVTTS